jgi:NADPH2:quinone reductase
MRAIAVVYNENQKKSEFREIQTELRPLGEHDLKIRIKAISVNPVDHKVASTVNSSKSEPRIVGWDAAGTVVGVGSKVRSYSVGDDVYYAGTISKPGSYAEYEIVDERIVGRKPKNLTDLQAAALPLATLTAYEMLFHKFKLDRKAVKNVLIIGGAGGVGSIAIQLLKAMTHSKVIVTAGRAESQQWVRQMGADEIISYKEDFLTQLKARGLGEVDAIFCTSGVEEHFENMIRALKPFGDIGALVNLESPINLNLLKPKSGSFHWEFMFARAEFQTPDMIKQQEILNEVAGLVESGKIKSTASLDLGRMSVENLTQAHELLKSQRTIGKIVLKGMGE